MNWFRRSRPQEETPNEIREKAARRLVAMSTPDLFPAVEAELGQAWRRFDAFQGKPCRLQAEEFLKHTQILVAAAEVLRGRFTES